MATANMPTHTTEPDTIKIAEVTEHVEQAGLDPERATLYVQRSDGRLFALLLDEIDADGDLVFTIGAEV